MEAARNVRLRQAMVDAERICRDKGEKLTPLRRDVLRLLAESDQPLGAYALSDRLQRRRRTRVDAPTVYRAIDFLMGIGLAMRIESRSAYVLADHAARSDASVFFLCDTCNATVAIENQDVAALIADNARSLGFHIDRPVIECNGTCASCSTLTTGPLAAPERLP